MAAVHQSRPLARAWGIIGHALDGDIRQLVDQETLVWFPAHLTWRAVGEVRGSNGARMAPTSPPAVSAIAVGGTLAMLLVPTHDLRSPSHVAATGADGDDDNPLQAVAETLATKLLGEKERLEQRNFSERLAPHLEVPVLHNANKGVNFQAVISAL